MAEDPHGKILWETVAGALARQAGDQAALTSRAKDLLGVATLTTTITGVILNDKLFKVTQINVPSWWIFLASIALVVVYGAGIWALVPKNWSFSPDATDFYSVEQESPEASENELYRAMAEGYLLADDGKNKLQQNEDGVNLIARLVLLETAGVIALGAAAFILAFLVERAA